MAIVDAHATSVTFEDNLSAAQTILVIRSISGGSGSVDVKDRTGLDATTYKVKAAGLIDSGQVSLEVYHDLSNAGQAALWDAWENRATREMVVTLSDASTLTFDCFISAKDGPNGAVSEDMVTTYTLEISGAVVDA